MKILVFLGFVSIYASCLSKYRSAYNDLVQNSYRNLAYKMFVANDQDDYLESMSFLTQISSRNISPRNQEFLLRVVTETGIDYEVLRGLIQEDQEAQRYCRNGAIPLRGQLEELILLSAQNHMTPLRDLQIEEDERLAQILHHEEEGSVYEQNIQKFRAYVEFTQCFVCLDEIADITARPGLQRLVQGKCNHIYCENCLQVELAREGRQDERGFGRCPACRDPWTQSYIYQLP